MMILALALCVATLTGTGTYLLLSRGLPRVLFGIVLWSHAANLVIFALGGGARGRAPFVPEGALQPDPGHADPVSQALVLTAIVIGFAMLAFCAVLFERTQHATSSLDVRDLRSEDDGEEAS